MPDQTTVSPFTQFWQLPELMHLIRRFTRQPELAALNRLSRTMYHWTCGLLYESITLKVNTNESTTSLQALEHTLKQKPDLARSVSNLQVKLFNHFSYTESPEPEQDESEHHLASLCAVTRNCGELQTLLVEYLYSSPRPAPADLASSIPNSLRNIHVHLQDYGLKPHDLGEYGINDTMLVRALELPNAKSIQLTLQEGPETNWKDLPINESVIKLALNDAYISTDTLGKILSSTPHLQHLELGLTVDANPLHSHVPTHLDCKKFDESLKTCQTTLETLKVTVKFDTRTALDVHDGGWSDSPWGLRGSLTILKNFPKLRVLAIAPELMLGWDSASAPDLTQVLPSSLESLVFSFDFRGWEASPWEFSLLCDKVADYVNSPHHTLLKSLTLTYYENQYEIELVQTELDNMQRRCKDHGIDFHLDKMPDW